MVWLELGRQCLLCGKPSDWSVHQEWPTPQNSGIFFHFHLCRACADLPDQRPQTWSRLEQELLNHALAG